MKIGLNIKDRLTIISILPTQGKITELVDVMDLVKILKFSEEEKKLVDYIENNGKITWNIEKDKTRDFDVTVDQIRIIQSTIKKMDDAGEITLNILDTCLKFKDL